jgi:hypothetical protein
MQVRWRQFECPACESVRQTQSDRKILASIMLCDKEGHLLSDCENLWECPATSAINQAVQWWSQCPFHGALEAHFLRVREMRGETVRIEAERKLGGWVELYVYSIAKRSGRILYSLQFTFYRNDPTVYVKVNERDEVVALPVVDFLSYAPRKWVKEVLNAFTLPQQSEAEKISAAEEVR